MTVWKQNTDPVPVPLHAVQVIPVDKSMRMLVMHRSEKVRSARNVWSFPSGLHEVGEPIHQCAVRELQEEYNLKHPRLVSLGAYDNIAGDADAPEQYHWVVSVFAAVVSDVTLSVNKEPDKHDQMVHLPVQEFVRDGFFDEYKFHESFDTWARLGRWRLFSQLIHAIHGGI